MKESIKVRLKQLQRIYKSQAETITEDIIKYLCTDEIYGYNHCHGSQYGNGGCDHGE